MSWGDLLEIFQGADRLGWGSYFAGRKELRFHNHDRYPYLEVPSITT